MASPQVTAVGSPTMVRATSGSVSGSWTTGGSAQPRNAGDLLVALVSAGGSTASAAAISTPAGWTQQAVIGNTTGSAHAWVAVYTKTAAGSDSAPSFTATLSGTAAMTCTLLEFAAGAVLFPMDVSGTYSSGVSAATLSAMTATTAGIVSVAGEYAVTVYCQEAAAAANTWNAGSGGWANLANDGTTGLNVNSVLHTAVDSLANPAALATATETAHWTTDTSAFGAAIIIVFAVQGGGLATFGNDLSTTISSGGTDAPAAGTPELWTASSWSGFTASPTTTPPTVTYLADPAAPSELIELVNSATGLVVRGVQGTTPVAHSGGFTVDQVFPAGLGVPRVYNVRDPQFGAAGDGSTDDTAAIQAAISAAASAGGGTAYIPEGTYKLSSVLTVAGSGVSILGAGSGATILHQTSTTANGITIAATTLASNKITGLRINGPNSGSGVGVYAAANSGSNPVVQLMLTDLIISEFGSHGVYTQNTIASVFTDIQSVNNLGRGFWLYNGTSTQLISCYANTNPDERGYYLQFLYYSGLISCAADGNAIGYELYQCDNVNIINSGAEDTAAGASGLDGSSFKVNGCTASGVRGARVVANAAIGLYFTGDSAECSVDGFTEYSVSGSPTASIQVDAGCYVTAANFVSITAQSFAPNTTSIINNYGYTLLPTGEIGTLTVDNGATAYGPVTLAAGITTAAPLNFVSGTNLTAAAAGAAEFDGTAFYLTAKASSRQVADTEQFQILSSPHTLSANLSAQAIFNATTSGAVVVAGPATYFFECLLDVTGLSSSSHNVAFAFGGGATYNSLMYNALSTSVSGGTAISVVSTSAGSTNLFASAVTATALQSVIKGSLRVGSVAGTIIPQLLQVTADAAASVAANSYFRIWPAGGSAVTNVGNWS